MNKQEFLNKYPQYLDMRLDELARNLHAKYFPDTPFEEFAEEFGVPEARPDIEDIARPEFDDRAPHGRFFKQATTPVPYGLAVEDAPPDIHAYVEKMAHTGAKRPRQGVPVNNDHPVSREYATAPAVKSMDVVGRPIPGTGLYFTDADGKSWFSYKDRDKGWQATADRELIEKIKNYKSPAKNQPDRPLDTPEGTEWSNVVGVDFEDPVEVWRSVLGMIGIPSGLEPGSPEETKDRAMTKSFEVMSDLVPILRYPKKILSYAKPAAKWLAPKVYKRAVETHRKNSMHYRPDLNLDKRAWQRGEKPTSDMEAYIEAQGTGERPNILESSGSFHGGR